jgi:pyridine nucleotide-disulfide oxidoreductase family protein
LKRLVLLGGGHAQLAVLAWLLHSRRRMEAVLIDPRRHALYSGMVPGVIAGDYAPEDVTLDLARIAEAAGVRFCEDAAARIDAASRRVLTTRGEVFDYDVLSVNLGSVSAAHGVPGVSTFATPVKPMGHFFQSVREAAWPECIAVAGGGAAGVELALTLSWRLQKTSPASRVSLVSASTLLTDFPPALRAAVMRIAAQRNIPVVEGRAVRRVEPGGITLAGGDVIEAGRVIWAAGAAPPPVIATSGLEMDAQGFIAINGCLQSVSHPDVFAAGDCATQLVSPQPKSGVIAVRQGPVLAANLQASLWGGAMRPFEAPRGLLALINTGGRQALGAWRGQTFQGGWVWRWKDWLDRRFMAAHRP